LDSLNVKRWRGEIANDIDRFPETNKLRAENASRLYAKVALFESIKEASTILELSLWKMKIDEYCFMHSGKRARVGVDSSVEHLVECRLNHRVECRINCGADVVVRNLLPYLLPDKKLCFKLSDDDDDDSSIGESSSEGSEDSD